MINLALPLAASLALVLVCAALANQIRLDRAQRPAPRHRPAAVDHVAPHEAEPDPEPFDPFLSPLEEVERFLADLEIERVWGEAHRENWARQQVADAGKSWETHMAKFSGAVLPREDDTRELETIA